METTDAPSADRHRSPHEPETTRAGDD